MLSILALLYLVQVLKSTMDSFENNARLYELTLLRTGYSAFH